ncbi:MAG: hypothetical protein WD737_05420 [Gemmatimonadota bacterium]
MARRVGALLVYVLVLAGSPAGYAGMLWMHGVAEEHPPQTRIPFPVTDRSLSVAGQPEAEAEPARERRELHSETAGPHDHGELQRIAAHTHDARRGQTAHGHDHLPNAATVHSHEDGGHAHASAGGEPEHRHAAAAHPAEVDGAVAEGHHEGESDAAQSSELDRSLQPGAPHAHGSFVHSHQQDSTDPRVLLTASVSEHFVAPPGSAIWHFPTSRFSSLGSAAYPRDAEFSVESPPPKAG